MSFSEPIKPPEDKPKRYFVCGMSLATGEYNSVGPLDQKQAERGIEKNRRATPGVHFWIAEEGQKMPMRYTRSEIAAMNLPRPPRSRDVEEIEEADEIDEEFLKEMVSADASYSIDGF